MWREEGVLVRVPASTANLGPGFDTLGMALKLHIWVSMKPAEQLSIRLHGTQLVGIPTDERNLIYKMALHVFKEAGIEPKPLEIDVYSDIPLTRGLGSSASAIIAGMVAANALIGNQISVERLYEMSTRIEQHPDNVGASLLGGIVVATWDGMKVNYVRLAPHKHLGVVVAIPRFYLETKEARNVLPNEVSMADAVYNISRSSLLVAALCTGQFERLADAMRDRIHQPYRAPLIPGMARILEEAPMYGALGVALSGAGPTLLALIDKREDDEYLREYLSKTLHIHGVDADVVRLEPSNEGAVCSGTAADFQAVLDRAQAYTEGAKRI
ncbi:homoserine kinase [Paenibacillus sp. 481]|uniref:homoserine kinase n=1 Tax=Paenibacillus sp. 481 TaxID=2835869 RepID=UPI001E5C4679|nr:homoserine kinase [Paenibacillus sp. 481]UHA74344.1 homoserine kinase [Paenibacillus sp. 481]